MKMNLLTRACDPDRLDSFLCGELNDAQEHEFHLHLNTCANCRRLLQERAADPEAWREAEELLRPSHFDSHLTDDSENSSLSHQFKRQPLLIQNVLAALGPTDDPAMLGRLGGYEVSGVVGAGGMGVVLKAIDKSLDRTVAIKVLAPHLATSGAARKRFAREAKAAAAVLHPNVIAIHSVSNDESLPYLVMPYVRGTSLQKRLDNEGPLSLQEILRIGSQIAAGLAAAHAQGLVHRDIKPANILLEDGVERVTITDFGLARAVDDATITHSGVIAGTPQYMSPEQARGEAVDGRSDLFSLGSVLYAICTGRPPFRAETTYGVMRRITDDEPTSIREINPDIPVWLCAIIARLMSKKATDRFASAEEVSELLEQCLAHVQQPAVVPLPQSCLSLRESSVTFAERKATILRRFSSISRPTLGVFAMIAALGLGLLGMVVWQATEAPDISGKWSGAGWGEVKLDKANDGSYDGTYTDTFGRQAGEIKLKWSRVEQRFNGTWKEGKDRFGKVSIRLAGDEIRGAWTTSRDSKIDPGRPRLADLLWVRNTNKPNSDEVPGVHVRLLLSAETHSQEMMSKNKGLDGLSIMGTGITGNVGGKPAFNIVGVIAHGCRLESFEETVFHEKKYWDAKFFVPQGPTSDGSNRSLSQKMLDQMKKQGVEFQLDHYRGQSSKALRSVESPADSRQSLQSEQDKDQSTLPGTLSESPEGSKTRPQPLERKSEQDVRRAESNNDHGTLTKTQPHESRIPVRARLLVVKRDWSNAGEMKPQDGIRKSLAELPETPVSRAARVNLAEAGSLGPDDLVSSLGLPSVFGAEDFASLQSWLRDQGLLLGELPIEQQAEPRTDEHWTSRIDLSAAHVAGLLGKWSFSVEMRPAFTRPDDQGIFRVVNHPYYLAHINISRTHQVMEGQPGGSRLRGASLRKTPKFSFYLPKKRVVALDWDAPFTGKASQLNQALGSKVILVVEDAEVPEPRSTVAGFKLPERIGSLYLDDERRWLSPPDELADIAQQKDPVQQKDPGTVDPSSERSEPRFSDTKELVLSMDSLKFMLDLDTGRTMPAPAMIRPEQEQMDVQTDQVQPYHYPTKLTGRGLVGLEVKSSDWDASAAEVRRALAGKAEEQLKEMDLGPEKNPTYFFKTRGGTTGVLQLLELVDEPKGIRFRYKTVETGPAGLKQSSAGEELKKFQGTWVLVSSEKDGEEKSEAKNPYALTFTGNHWKVHHDDEVAIEGTLKLVDVASTPMKFDLLKPKGLGPDPTVDYGIYEWKENTLRYCVRNGPVGGGFPGGMDVSILRPTEFATKDGDGRILYVWKRAESAPSKDAAEAATQSAAAAAAALAQEKTVSEEGAASGPLEFLAEFPKHREQTEGELKALTTPQFEAAAKARKLGFEKTTREGNPSYYLPTGDGHTVIVMFRDGKWSGIQRVRGELHPDPSRVELPDGTGKP